MLEEGQTGERQEWKDIALRSLTYKSNWAQWESLSVVNGVLESHWESAEGRFKLAQIVRFRSRMNDILTEQHGGPSGDNLGVNKTLNMVRQRYYWLQARKDVKK
jgi:hypothetical protein